MATVIIVVLALITATTSAASEPFVTIAVDGQSGGAINATLQIQPERALPEIQKLIIGAPWAGEIDISGLGVRSELCELSLTRGDDAMKLHAEMSIHDGIGASRVPIDVGIPYGPGNSSSAVSSTLQRGLRHVCKSLANATNPQTVSVDCDGVSTNLRGIPHDWLVKGSAKLPRYSGWIQGMHAAATVHNETTELQLDIPCDALRQQLAHKIPSQLELVEEQRKSVQIVQPGVHCEHATLMLTGVLKAGLKLSLWGWARTEVNVKVRLRPVIDDGRLRVDVVKAWTTGGGGLANAAVAAMINGLLSVTDTLDQKVNQAVGRIDIPAAMRDLTVNHKGFKAWSMDINSLQASLHEGVLHASATVFHPSLLALARRGSPRLPSAACTTSREEL